MPLRIAIVGGGLAGSSTALALCQAGHEVSLFEAGPSLASGASGNWVGALHPHVGRQPSTLSELTVLGFERSLHALRALTTLGLLKKGLDWDTPGHVQIIHPKKAEAAKAALAQSYVASQGGNSQSKLGQNQDNPANQHSNPWPPSLVRWSAPGEHIPSPWPGYFFPQGAWVCPKRWVEANVAAASQGLDPAVAEHGGKLHVHLKHPITSLALQGLQNQFDWVVLACAQHSLALLGLPVQHCAGLAGIVKGQVTRVQMATGTHGQPARLPYVLSGQTYAICPPQASWMLIGATYEHPSTANAATTEEAAFLNHQAPFLNAHASGTPLLTPLPHTAANAENLRRFQACLPGWPLGPVLDARAAWRFVWHDKLPLVGPVDAQVLAELRERGEEQWEKQQRGRKQQEAAGWPVAEASWLGASRGTDALPPPALDLSRILLCTAFASRGLTWAAMAGEVLAAWLESKAATSALLGGLGLERGRVCF